MPSHFSTIGFLVPSEEESLALANRAAPLAQAVAAEAGEYLRWTGDAGEQLWLQVGNDGNLVGMNPHFSGKSRVRVKLEARIDRDEHSPLDGAFRAWASPPEEAPDEGMYPFVFDVPDALAYPGLSLPCVARAQIAAFAHEIRCYESPEAYDALPEDQAPKLASQAFIPSGLFSPDGDDPVPPEARAVIAGHVIEASVCTNGLSGVAYYWALVETYGGIYDVVIDPALLERPPCAGNVLSGQFWLSGRLVAYPGSGVPAAA